MSTAEHCQFARSCVRANVRACIVDDPHSLFPGLYIRRARRKVEWSTAARRTVDGLAVSGIDMEPRSQGIRGPRSNLVPSTNRPATRTAAEPDQRTRRGPRACSPKARGRCYRRVDLVSYWTVSTVKLDLTCGRSAKRWRHTRHSAKEGRQKAAAAIAAHVGVHRRPFGACLTESMLVFAVTSSNTRSDQPDSWVVEHRTAPNSTLSKKRPPKAAGQRRTAARTIR